jgi:hypothetical protein
VSFDDGMMLELAARGIAASDSGASAGVLIGIPQAQREAFLADFMARNMLSVAPVGSSPIDLSLAGSARATRMLEECQSSMARHAPGTG